MVVVVVIVKAAAAVAAAVAVVELVVIVVVVAAAAETAVVAAVVANALKNLRSTNAPWGMQLQWVEHIHSKETDPSVQTFAPSNASWGEFRVVEEMIIVADLVGLRLLGNCP